MFSRYKSRKCEKSKESIYTSNLGPCWKTETSNVRKEYILGLCDWYSGGLPG